MIRTKLFLALSLLVVLIGATSAFIGVRLIRDRVVQEAQTRVELDLRSIWSVYHARQQEIETVLRLVANDRLLPRGRARGAGSKSFGSASAWIS